MAGAKVKTEFTDKVIDIKKDVKRDGGHRYDFIGEGKKGFRWILTLESGIVGAVRKTVENGQAPFKAGDRIKGKWWNEEKAGLVISVEDTLDESGAPIPGAAAGKSTYNDPRVTVPKMNAECHRRALRILLKLKEWTDKLEENSTDEFGKDPFHITNVTDQAIFSMAKTIFLFITNAGQSTERDSMELRMTCIDNAITCMEFPSFKKLKGNDESIGDGGKLIIDKKLVVKICEQAEVFLTQIKSEITPV